MRRKERNIVIDNEMAINIYLYLIMTLNVNGLNTQIKWS